MQFQAYTINKHPDQACIEVKAPENEERTPVHICCIIDTSASMRHDDKLKNVKNSMNFLLEYLGPNDKISIITFSDAASTILLPIHVTSLEKDNIRTRISIMEHDSNTNLSAGLIAARECLQMDPGNLKQGILLLTDGIANMGVTRPDHLVDIVTNLLQTYPGTSISCVGYGTDHNVDLLQQISGVGGGSYYVVNNMEDVATVFGDVLGGLISCCYQQIRILLPPNTSVRTRYIKKHTPEHTEVVIGDLSGGMSAVFLAAIPKDGSIRLKTYDLTNHCDIELETRVIDVDDETLQTNGEAHYLRFEVLSLMEQSRDLMNPFAKDEKVKELVNKLDLQTSILQEYKLNHPHSLWDILIEQLSNCKRNLENRKKAGDLPQVMSQNVAYLGRMRGIAAVSSAMANAPLPAISSAYSNSIQRHISAEMVQRSQVNDNDMEDDNELEPGAPPSAAGFRFGSAAAPQVIL
jgi:hypothetical protein